MSSESTETSSEGSLEHPSGDPAHLRVYFDADVLFAGAASPSDHSASQVLLALSESTLIEGVTSALAVDECRRNLEAKLPAATGDFDHPLVTLFALILVVPTGRIFRTSSPPSSRTVRT
jgi:hypothetical protein